MNGNGGDAWFKALAAVTGVLFAFLHATWAWVFARIVKSVDRLDESDRLLPEKLRQTKHDAIDKVTPNITDLDDRVTVLEAEENKRQGRARK